MIIVAGHLRVADREGYLAGCGEVVALARQAPGCLDFSLAADLVEADRINIFERWASRAQVEAFRGSGPSSEQQSAILSASVTEYDVTGEHSLT
jgi:quinol monooxygenase YgiN